MKGRLYQNKHTNEFVEVISTYNKPWVDPECNQSVEIRSIVRYVYITGEKIGIETTSTRRSFTNAFFQCTEDPPRAL